MATETVYCGQQSVDISGCQAITTHLVILIINESVRGLEGEGGGGGDITGGDDVSQESLVGSLAWPGLAWPGVYVGISGPDQTVQVSDTVTLDHHWAITGPLMSKQNISQPANTSARTKTGLQLNFNASHLSSQ